MPVTVNLLPTAAAPRKVPPLLRRWTAKERSANGWTAHLLAGVTSGQTLSQAIAASGKTRAQVIEGVATEVYAALANVALELRGTTYQRKKEVVGQRLAGFLALTNRLEFSEVRFVIEVLLAANWRHYRGTTVHQQNVTLYAAAVAREAGIASTKRLKTAAVIHDIGKIGVPFEVLTDRGPRTPQNWALLQMHLDLTVAILSQIRWFRNILPIIYNHHRPQESQYPLYRENPEGLNEKGIGTLDRILILCDCLDAGINGRPYSRPKAREVLIAELRAETEARGDAESRALVDKLAAVDAQYLSTRIEQLVSQDEISIFWEGLLYIIKKHFLALIGKRDRPPAHLGFLLDRVAHLWFIGRMGKQFQSAGDLIQYLENFVWTQIEDRGFATVFELIRQRLSDEEFARLYEVIYFAFLLDQGGRGDGQACSRILTAACECRGNARKLKRLIANLWFDPAKDPAQYQAWLTSYLYGEPIETTKYGEAVFLAVLSSYGHS